MSPNELKIRLEKLAPGTVVEVRDLTGGQDHYEARVISPVFDGKMTMDQHRMVFDLLKPEMASGEVHALVLKTSAK